MSILSHFEVVALVFLIAAGCGAPKTAGAAQPERSSATREIVVNSKPPEPNTVQAGAPLYGLTRDDLVLITKALPNLQLVVPVRQVRSEASFGGRLVDLRLTGTTAQYAESHGLELSRGRFLTKKDIEQLENIAVLNEQAAGHLFGQEDPLGKQIRIDRHYFLVVGTLKSRHPGELGRGEEARSEIYVPITTMRSRLGDLHLARMSGTFQVEHFQLSRIELTLKTEDVEKTLAVLKELLQLLHKDASYEVSAASELETKVNE